MTITVGPTQPFPTHHASLSDGTTTVGFVFANSAGKIDPRALRRYALSRTAIKTSTGSSQYSDLELPYLANAQDDWAGGMGQETYEDDTSRYRDGQRADTTRANELFNAGMERYCKNYQAADSFQPSAAGGIWHSLISSYRYIYHDWTATATYSADFVELWIAKVGTPGTLTVELRNTDHTGAVLKTATVTAATIGDVTAQLYKFDWTSTQAIVSGSTYSFVIYGAATDTTANHWELCCGTGFSGSSGSSGGTLWTTPINGAPYFRVTVADVSTHWSFIEYKKALYAVTHPTTGNSFLWINGDRGAADDNTGALTTLIDATKSWTPDEWIGCIVFITQGPGSEEEQPWRVITDNDATTLTVAAWNVVHTTSTEYVILGSEKFTSVLDLGGYVTDSCVADEFVYFARGDSGSLNVLRYQAYNNAGTWTDRNAAESHKAVHLCAIRTTAKIGRMQLYGTQNNNTGGKVVWRMTIPRFWGALYREIATITNPDQPFSEQVVANVTQVNNGWSTQITVLNAKGTGVIASEAITATNISEGTGFGFDFMSSLALTAADLQLQYGNEALLAGTLNTINFPAVIGSYTWEWVYLPFSMTADGAVYAEDAVLSIGLNEAVDKAGDHHYYISDGIFLVSSYPEYITLPADAPITGIIAYAGNATEPVLNPWVITSNAIYEIQTQNSSQVVALPMGEIAEISSEKNAEGKTVNDVYFWFNLAGRLERYYSRNLDDVGPDRDAGLPAARSGWPRALLSYPGRVYAAIDAGTAGTSSILVYKSGWHEMYRAPRAGKIIYSMSTITLPNDTNTSRLFFSMDGDILWIPIAINPPQSSTFRYAIEGHYESSWIYSGMKDITKLFRSVTLFLSSGYNNSDNVYLDYKLDHDSSWTVVGAFAAGSLVNDELYLPTNTTGKRIKIRLRIRSTITACDVIVAILMKGIGVVPIKYGYTWNTKLTEGNLSVDLLDELFNAHGALQTTDLALAKLDAWASAATPLTLRSGYSAVDNKTVILNAPGLQPITYIPELTEGPLEEYMVQIDCSEV